MSFLDIMAYHSILLYANLTTVGQFFYPLQTHKFVWNTFTGGIELGSMNLSIQPYLHI